MIRLGAVVAAFIAAVFAQGACADPLPLRGGSYEITARLELPHLERWAVDRTVTVCLPAGRGAGEIPVPVFSANNPFAGCSAAHLVSAGASLEYDIVCPGRGAAKAHATYTLNGDRLAGYVAMTMGAKNMTMTEVQHARRLGDCSPALAQSTRAGPNP